MTARTTESKSASQTAGVFRNRLAIGILVASTALAGTAWAEKGNNGSAMREGARDWAPLAMLYQRPENRPESQFDYIFGQLDITPAQADSLKTLLADFMATEKATRMAPKDSAPSATPPPTREERVAAMAAEKQALQERLATALSAVLTPIQLSGLQDYISAHAMMMPNAGDRMGKNRKGGGNDHDDSRNQGSRNR